MPAYLIVEHIITDAAKFDEYRTRVAPMIAKHGGRYLTKGATHRFPEGGHWRPERVVIIEFADMQAIDAWYCDAVHQRARHAQHARRRLTNDPQPSREHDQRCLSPRIRRRSGTVRRGDAAVHHRDRIP